MIYFISNNKDNQLFRYDNKKISKGSLKQLFDYFRDKEWIGIDTETTGFDPYKDKLLTIQLGDYKNQFVVDAQQVDIKQLKDILLFKKLILQNAKFDLRFFNKLGIFPNNIYDTYLAEVVLTKGIPDAKKNLQYLATKYCKTEDVDKTLRGLIHRYGLIEEVIEYAANDVKFLHWIRKEQLEAAVHQDVIKQIELENKFVPVLAYCEYCGLYFDKEKWEDKYDNSKKLWQKAEEKLNHYIVDNNITNFIDNQLDLFSTSKKTTLNWSSEQQVKELFKQLGIDVKVKEKGKWRESIESRYLERQKDNFKILPLYLEYKKLEKECTTYGLSFLRKIHPITGRIHTNFSQSVDTGRMSSGGKNKATGEDYVNFQNIPRTPEEGKEPGVIYARECIVPQSKDNVFVDTDYTGQESIILANKSEDKNMIEFYQSGLGDMHSWVASKIFPELAHLSLKRIKSHHKDKRYLAKTANFVLAYGGTGWTVANRVNVSEEVGNKIEKAYFEAFPDLKKYYDKCEKEALEKGYILIDRITKSKFYIAGFDKFRQLQKAMENKPEGYWKRYREEKARNSIWYKKEKEENGYYFRWKSQIRRLTSNFPIQGEGANITKGAGILFFQWLLNNNLIDIVKIVNIVHDEILIECPTEIAEIISIKIKECMEESGKLYCTIIPLKATPEIQTHWAH